MHAKLEVFGIATMLKIMFATSTEELKKAMSRNELVSFINLFAKLSKSVNNVHEIDMMIKKAHRNLNLKKIKCIIFVGIVGVIITLTILTLVYHDSDNNRKTIDTDKNDKKQKNMKKKKVE